LKLDDEERQVLDEVWYALASPEAGAGPVR
jgi:hypothetical protein